MAGEKEKALLNTEKLADKADLKQLAEQLNQLIQSDEWKKKLTKNLDKWVSKVLKNSWIVWQIQEIYKSQDDAQAKAGLERLIKLADVDAEVRDEQREINVRLEALREQQELSQEIREDANKLKDAVKVQLTTKINELYSKGDYQWALDNAVYLLSAEDRATAFSLIKAILKATPSNETLYIKDKKISYSKRREWIQKMEDNMEAAAREFQASYYQDVSLTDEWTLGQSSDKHSDKKAAKLLDKELSGNKELYNISKRINVPSAWGLIEKNYADIKKIFDESVKNHPDDADAAEKEFKKNLDKNFFISHGYLPKSGNPKDLGNKEWEALTDLCAYRIRAELETPVEGKPSAKAAYEALIDSQVVWVATSELEQARNVLKQVSVEGLTWDKAKETLMTLLWDLNWDGRVTNTSIREWVDRKWLDKWTLFWGQILNMFDTAVKRFWEEKVIGNIQSIINWLNWLKEFKVEPKTVVGLISAFKNKPEALIAFRNKLMNEPDLWNWMFNTGTEYVTTRLEALNREADLRKSLENFFDKTDEGKEALETMSLELDKVMEEELEKRTLPNLKKYQECDDYKKLTDGQKQQIDKVVDMLSTEDWRKQFLSSPEIKNMYKNFIISGIWLNFMDISIDGQHMYWVWVGWGVMNEKFNAWLAQNTKNIISKATASVGMYCADGNVSMGLWLGFGSSTNLGENAKAYYSVNAISWSPFDPQGLSFGAVVWAETRIRRSDDDSLDKKSAKYIWVAAAYGFWLDLSSPDFNTNNVSLSAYWRRDKLEGVERKAEKVRERMAPIFQHLFEVEWDVTVQSIVENLRGGKMNNGKEFSWFANTSWDTLYKTATAIFNMFNSYKGRLKAENPNKDEIIQKISENFADNLAREMRNKDIEKIVDEGLHLSWVNVWVSWSFARLFTGFFLSGGLTFTYYEDSEYKENPAMLEKAQKGMENSDNYDYIINKSKTYKEKMDTINQILGWNYLEYKDKVIARDLKWTVLSPASINLSKEVFGKDIKVLCHPDLAPYIIQENGEIKMPGNADISLAQIRHQWKVDSTLILGAKSTSGCEAITLDSDKLKWDGNSTVEFGSKKDDFEKYNVEIKTKVESMKVWIDWKPNDNLKKYLEDNWDALVKFRLASADYKKFIAAIKSDSSRGDNFVENTIKYLPDELRNLVTKDNDVQARDDIRFIYASLSRVSQTRDKQLAGPDLKKKANEYLDRLTLSSWDKALLEWYVTKVEGGAVLSDDEWSKMKWILGINYNNWEYRTSNSNAERLFHILTPVKKLAEHRTSAYERRIKSEYSNLVWGSDILITARNAALERLNNVPTAKGDLKEWWIGAVAWYDDRNSITDKFVSSPKIISWSEAVIPDSENLNVVKKHFLDELSRDDVAQFKAIKEKIISTLEKSTKKEDKETAQRWKDLSNDKFIDAILTEKTKNEKWEDVFRVSFNMQYGFFADCVNETILLGDINVVTTTEEQIQAPHDVRYYDATVTSDAVTIGHSFSVWATFGEVKTNKPEKPEEPEKPEKPEEPEEPTKPVAPEQWKTEPIVDLDGIEWATEVDFNNQTFTYEGTTYTFVVDEVDWQQTMVAWTPDNHFYVVTKWPDGKLQFTNLEWFSWASILGGATEVTFDMEQYNRLMEEYNKAKAQYDIDKAQYDIDIKKYEQDLEKYEIAKAQYDVDFWRYQELKAKYDIDYDVYLKKYESFINGLPVGKRAIAWNIVKLNYQILTAEPSARDEYVKQARKYRMSLVLDRIVG